MKDLIQMGRAVRSARIMAGMNQKDLAKASGVGLCSISFIEGGSKNHEPRSSTVAKLAAALNVDASEFLKYFY